MRRLAAVALVALPLAGCGGGETTGTGAAQDEGPAANLEIMVTDGAGRREATLECDPDGGTHPSPEEACRALASNVGALEPVPQDVACTQEYGGPERARITGTLSGREVDAELSRSNGCEISRWDHLEAVLDLDRAE
jgi:Subtilisin inhibitor-like